MAKKAPAQAEPIIENKELIAFTEVVTPQIGRLEPIARTAVYQIIESFLTSLNRRELEMRQLVDSWKASPAITKLREPRTGVVTIKSQEDADLAASLCNDIAKDQKAVMDSWAKETNFFAQFHTTLTTTRRKPLIDALGELIVALKSGNRNWLLVEEQRKQLEAAKIAQQQAKEQAKVEKQFEKAGIPAPAPPPPPVQEPTKIAGMTGKKVHLHRVPDLMALVKKVASGKVPLSAIQPNDYWLAEETSNNFAAAVKGADEKLYLFDGTVEVYTDISMSRR